MEYVLVAGLILLLRVEYANRNNGVDVALKQLAERSVRVERGYYLRCSLLTPPDVHRQSGGGGETVSKPGAGDSPSPCENIKSDNDALSAIPERDGKTDEDIGRRN